MLIAAVCGIGVWLIFTLVVMVVAATDDGYHIGKFAGALVGFVVFAAMLA